MLKLEDIKIGNKIKRINNDSLLNKIGTITDLDLPRFWVEINHTTKTEMIASSLNFCYCWELIESAPNQTNMARQEKPCKICSKKNDLNVAKCWWCEVLNPTSDVNFDCT